MSVKQVEHEEDEDGISDENLKRNPDFQKYGDKKNIIGDKKTCNFIYMTEG